MRKASTPRWRAVSEGYRGSQSLFVHGGCQDGAAPDDSKILEYLRKGSKPFYLVVNKVDGLDLIRLLLNLQASG